jgi:hypothetical protein
MAWHGEARHIHFVQADKLFAGWFALSGSTSHDLIDCRGDWAHYYYVLRHLLLVIGQARLFPSVSTFCPSDRYSTVLASAATAPAPDSELPLIFFFLETDG